MASPLTCALQGGHSESASRQSPIQRNSCPFSQIFALPGMELVFDHAPVTEGLETLSGHPDPQGEVPGEPADEGTGGADGFPARPLAMEVRMDCFARSSVVAEDDDSATYPPHPPFLPFNFVIHRVTG